MLEAMTQAQVDPTAARRAIARQSGHAAVNPVAKLEPILLPAVPNGGNVSRLRTDRNVIATNDCAVQVLLRMAKPCIAVLANVLSAQECDALVALSKAKLRPSTIVDPATGAIRAIEDRSSEGTFFRVNETPFIAQLDRRIAELMNWPLENGEGLQILRYGIGGEYKPHFDYFPPEDAGSRIHLQQGGQRVSTLVIYLNDVTHGGETIFPELGFAVTPRKGSAVYFEYFDVQGQLDALTLHGGAPVRQGEKWIATKWMRQFAYGSAQPGPD